MHHTAAPSTTAGPTAPTEAPTRSWAEDATESSGTTVCRAIVLAVVGTAVVVTVVSRVTGVIVARGHAAEHLAHKTPEALERARAAHYHVMHAGHNPMVALLVAALQTTAGLGDVTTVAAHSPALETLANSLDFLALQIPLPGGIQAAWFGAGAVLSDAEHKFAGSLFAVAIASLALAALHAPVVLYARARILAALSDEDETKERINRIRQQRGLPEDTSVTRRSAGKPPDLYDSAMASFPRLELWLLLLIFQGMATSTSAVLAEEDARPSLRYAAGAMLTLLCLLIAAIAAFVAQHTRGPGASSKFTKVVLKDEILHLWQDHEVLDLSDHLDVKTRSMSCYRERRTVYGDYYSGFTTRWGLFFTPFRPVGGAPWGMVIMLTQRALVGICIGSLSGDEQHIQNAQIVVLMILYALLGTYFIALHPFVRVRTNRTEGVLALLVFVFLATCLYTIAADGSHSKDTVTAALVSLVALALALRIYFMVHATVDRLQKIGGTAGLARRMSIALHAKDVRERRHIRKRKEQREAERAREMQARHRNHKRRREGAEVIVFKAREMEGDAEIMAELWPGEQGSAQPLRRSSSRSNGSNRSRGSQQPGHVRAPVMRGTEAARRTSARRRWKAVRTTMSVGRALHGAAERGKHARLLAKFESECGEPQQQPQPAQGRSRRLRRPTSMPSMITHVKKEKEKAADLVTAPVEAAPGPRKGMARTSSVPTGLRGRKQSTTRRKLSHARGNDGGTGDTKRKLSSASSFVILQKDRGGRRNATLESAGRRFPISMQVQARKRKFTEVQQRKKRLQRAEATVRQLRPVSQLRRPSSMGRLKALLEREQHGNLATVGEWQQPPKKSKRKKRGTMAQSMSRRERARVMKKKHKQRRSQIRKKKKKKTTMQGTGYVGAAAVALKMHLNHDTIYTRPTWGGGKHKEKIVI